MLLKSHSTRGAHPTLGWDAVGGDLRIHELPGDHMSSITEHVAAFGERMRAVLDEAAR